MDALMITFRTSIPAEQLAMPFEEYAGALRRHPGLIRKAWIRDGDTFGDFDVRGFEVLHDLSAATRVVAARPLAAEV